ncbi:MAG: polysaccharide deacetylase family protein [Oscillospiraceae bacterium]|nr:polysaccharide deacetylase family protein [Oscillospiraceae bacterium]
MLRRLAFGLMVLFSLFYSPPPEEAPVRLPILMYHDVKWEHTGKDVITPEELRSDLKWLREEGYTAVTLKEVVSFVLEGAPLPEKPIVLSFDDGLRSALDTVLPLLREAEMPMVLSVIGLSADEVSTFPEGKPYAHATWAHLRELKESGLVELQNHSYDLHRTDRGAVGVLRRPGEGKEAYEERLSGDALLLQERLLQETGCLPSTFTYPYGAYDALSESVLRELGFQATLTCDFGMNLLDRDPDCLFGLKRICRAHGADLAALLTEAENTLKWR